MGKIIRFPGSPEENPESGSHEPSVERKVEINTDKLRVFLETLARLVKRVPGHNKKLSLEENLVVVETYSDAELKRWVEDSNEFQWAQKPMFFAAVAMEVKRRNLF